MTCNRLYIKINSITREFIQYIDNGDYFKQDDLFIIINYGEQIRRTTVKKNSKTPDWNDEFLFKLNENTTVSFKIYDHDSWSKNELLEETVIEIPDEKVKNMKDEVIDVTLGYVKVFDLHKHEQRICELHDLLAKL